MANTLKDISGQKFHKLTALHQDLSKKGSKNSYWICSCECGNTKSICSSNLKSGKQKTCGCEEYVRTHGKAKTRTYNIWVNMKYRCKTDKFPNYGGRGIKVCERWLVFENFFEDMGEAPINYSIERVDVNKDY